MSSNQLLDNKKSVPSEFNRVAKNYDFATLLSQGYQKDLHLSASRMNILLISVAEPENQQKHVWPI